LLRLMHLRKLVPLGELLGLAEKGPARPMVPRVPTVPNVPRVPTVPQVPSVPKVQMPAAKPSAAPAPKAAPAPGAPSTTTASTSGTVGTPGTLGTVGTDSALKDAFLAEVKSQKSTFYNLVVASAYSIEAKPDKIVFAFQANKKNAKLQCEDQKAWLATIAEKVAGRPLPVTIVTAEADAPPAPAPSTLGSPVAPPKGNTDDLKAEAMANATVQAVLEIFPVDKTTIEER
jgi:hypothetical protein